MNLVIVELGLIIVAIIISMFITHTGNLIIENRLDGIQNSLNYLIRYVNDFMPSTVCKKQLEDKSNHPLFQLTEMILMMMVGENPNT
ncbi:hypothetical protein AP9108_24670 [Arthrospira sp. PCC 9108]|nr:hypothetical protein AP9108_24670 [Arthrospira sp. PCC 9108]